MKAVIALSGGLDSTVALGWYVYRAQRYLKKTVPNEVRAVGFNYGSTHNKYEIEAARKVADHYKVPFQVIPITLGHNESALLGSVPVPEGHYEAESMRQTVVPGRNTLIAAHLLSLAEAWNFDRIVMGIHQGDHHIYPDCRPEWAVAFDQVCRASSEGKVSFCAPLLSKTKKEIVKMGLANNVPFHLTRTCYKDQEIACGKCGSCRERLEAFELNGAKDPIPYETEIPLT